jgi:hypothetical protein
VLVLDDPTTWPRHLTDQLNQPAVLEVLRRRRYAEELVDEPAVRPILAEVEQYAYSVPLAAYHCTKQLADRPYTVTGLRPLNFEQHHAELRDLLRSRPEVSPTLFRKIDAGLTDWRMRHTGRREKMLWFCVDRPLVLDRGTELFFKYFGGEAVYFGFMSDPEVLSVLESVGEPVVVEARVSSEDLKVFQELALGRTLVSYFARSVNPRFYIDHREGYIPKAVPPADIVAVHPHKEFTRAVRPRRKR